MDHQAAAKGEIASVFCDAERRFVTFPVQRLGGSGASVSAAVALEIGAPGAAAIDDAGVTTGRGSWANGTGWECQELASPRIAIRPIVLARHVGCLVTCCPWVSLARV